MTLYQLIKVNALWYVVYLLMRSPLNKYISLTGFKPGTFYTAVTQPPLAIATIFLVLAYVSYFLRLKKEKTL